MITKSFTTKLTAFAAAVILCCSILFIHSNARAQPCTTCLIAQTDVNQALCGGYTWVLKNTCTSCISSITISGAPHPCSFCLVYDAGYGDDWTVTYNSTLHTYTLTPGGDGGDCLQPGGLLQIASCLQSGDSIQVCWSPADPPCTSPVCANITVP